MLELYASLFRACRYQSIQRTMATDEDSSGARLERSVSAECDPEAAQTGQAFSSIALQVLHVRRPQVSACQGSRAPP